MIQTANTTIHLQLSAGELIKRALLAEGKLNDTGALCINTGTFTGRSPLDKFTVEDELSIPLTDWKSDFNIPIKTHHFEALKEDLLAFINNQYEIFQRLCYAGAHPDYSLKINVITQSASANLFAYNMFLRPEDVSTENVIGEWTVIQAPDFEADPAKHGTRSKNFSVISFKEKMILIGGTGYTGEIKKGIFTVLNFLMPANYGVLSMHCSANIGTDGDTALFFGLSGTGKTTLSTDPQRWLIGDDEHGWSKDAVFNFEGGCYAKTIGLNAEHEPEIFAALRHGALVENVVFKANSNEIDFNDNIITENTRVSYPITFIDRIARPSVGGIPRNIFFLTCDATGVLPPISKLSIEQAEYYFLSGYTSKVAGTETGIKSPKPTFSTCFGAPFLPLNPNVYAEMLGTKLREHEIKVWLVNTGWCGLPFHQGKRISLSHTRTMVNAALNGVLDKADFEIFPFFDLAVPSECENIPTALFNPYKTYQDDSDYLERMKKLASDFENNFTQYASSVRNSVIACNPTSI